MAEAHPVLEAHDRLSPEARECLQVLGEVARTLSPWSQQVCLVGGWAVYAVSEAFVAGMPSPPLRHRGSLDVDLALGWPQLDAPTAKGITTALRAAGYRVREAFRWERREPPHHAVDLMVVPPAGHSAGVVQIAGHTFGPLWEGEVLLRDAVTFLLRTGAPAESPAGIALRVAGAAGLLHVKLQAAFGRDLQRAGRQKHLYDVFVLARLYPGGADALAQRLAETLSEEATESLRMHLAAAFGAGGSDVFLVAELLGAGATVLDQQVSEVQVTMGRLISALELRLG